MHSNLGKEKRELVPIAAFKEGKVFAPLTFEGSCNRDLFETWRFEKFDSSASTRKYHYHRQNRLIIARVQEKDPEVKLFSSHKRHRLLINPGLRDLRDE